jgi:cellulose synthase/poly-beta-1,6-N-acetylglucosamine synthase-like glycosyltransferase
MLDFYNPQTNWLARCFTMEYAAWFRVVLPGLARLGLPVPLGGTTLFFRRAALEAVGGWDAHNVTEDADLGMRLYRRGYRTEVIRTVTREEANCHTLPWIRQRSRWIKGYMMTWRVHMRDPVRLWRDLGPRGFFGFQVLFLGSILHALLAPVLISFWLCTAGLPHAVGSALPAAAFLTLFGLFLLAEAANITIGVIALRRSGQRIHPLWLLTLHVYHPLASLAAMKALWEVLRRPFFWDKTRHGRHDRLSGA